MIPTPDDAQAVIVFGPTGTAGAGAVDACLSDPTITEVRAVTRRPLGVSHPRLREVRCADFARLDDIASHFAGVLGCLFCLGTSVRNVRDEDEYRHIHVIYALAAARALRATSNDAAFIYLSGAGAHRTSRMMWARVKAEAEDRLADVGPGRHANVRPAAILPMHPTGLERLLLAPLVRAIPALGIPSRDLGRAMLRLAVTRDWTGTRTLENRELRALARAAAVPPP
ncbi:epimerase [Luteitalea sp. TBR-22]|uniref:hypothetical protein n=1 Tax=Luteitalea sp. TBR-22 TaxID=2802971 RepID=UPI001AF17B2D|nr:hypothetical protein [Luteitalea sp. TBR-22]BCS31689.1 epimerase [Luteitalea sp. TBR-22]